MCHSAIRVGDGTNDTRRQVNAALDRATLGTVRTTAKLLGNKFMRMAGTELLSQATPEILGKAEDLIVSSAPDSLLDKAMRRRLDTISARPLLNMLARAERLGYDANDIIEDGSQGAPAVAKPAKTATAPPHGQASLPSPNPPAQLSSACAPLSCPLCHRQFTAVAVRDHVSFFHALWLLNRESWFHSKLILPP